MSGKERIAENGAVPSGINELTSRFIVSQGCTLSACAAAWTIAVQSCLQASDGYYKLLLYLYTLKCMYCHITGTYVRCRRFGMPWWTSRRSSKSLKAIKSSSLLLLFKQPSSKSSNVINSPVLLEPKATLQALWNAKPLMTESNASHCHCSVQMITRCIIIIIIITITIIILIYICQYFCCT
jgi:hypothetical protein